MLLIIFVRNTAKRMTSGFFTLWAVYRRCVVFTEEAWFKLADPSFREPYKVPESYTVLSECRSARIKCVGSDVQERRYRSEPV
jgi:hypothetical protein